MLLLSVSLELFTALLENTFEMLTRAMDSAALSTSTPPWVSVPSPTCHPSFCFPAGFTSHTADAANPDNTAAPAHRGAPAKGGGWGSGWEEAEISGTEPGGRHPLQTEEEGLGDVIGKESWRAHPDKHAASGAATAPLLSPQRPCVRRALPAPAALIAPALTPHIRAGAGGGRLPPPRYSLRVQ